MDDDLFEILFFWCADWRLILFVVVVLVALSVTGVIPWGDWL